MTDRFHSLDFLRAFALLMGVLIHVLMLFLEPFDGSEPRLGASIIFIWIHTWRMPLFMLFAGFFTALSLSKRDVGNYALNRLIRLGAPILLLWMSFPQSMKEAAVILKYPNSYLGFTMCHSHCGWITCGSFIVTHILWDSLLLKSIIPEIFSFIADYKLSLSRVLILWLPILILLSPLNKPTGGIFGDIPTTFGEVKLGSMLFMASFFMIGLQIHKSSQFLERLQRRQFWLPSLIVFSLVPVGLLGWGGFKDEPFTFAGPLEMWIVNGLAGTAALLLVLSIIGCAMCRISSRVELFAGWLAFISDLRLSRNFVISVSGTLIFFGVNDWIVVLLGFAAGIFFPVLIYYTFIAWTPLDWVFNGYKSSKYRSQSALINRLSRYL